MSKKVKLAVIDDDLKIRTLKNYDVSASGNKVSVMSGGEGHFMPSFDNNSFNILSIFLSNKRLNKLDH